MKLNVSKETKIIAGVYVAYMFVFYFLGITRAQFDSFVAFALLTGLFVLGVKWAKKIFSKK